MWGLNHKKDWTPKNWCFQIVVLEKTLESPLDCKEIKPVNPNGNQPWIFIDRTDAEAEAPIVWPCDAKSWPTGKDPDAGKDWGQGEKGLTEDKMVGWHHRLNQHESEQTLGESEGQGSLACCSPWGHIESNMTEQLNSMLTSQLMLTAINVWFLTKEIHSLRRLPLASQDHLLHQSPHTCKAMNLEFKSVNGSWLLSLGFNLTLTLALWQSQDHTSLTIAPLDFL